MPSTHLARGVVLKSLNYKDKDKIITFLCKDRVFVFIALGVRTLKSKNRLALEVGTYCEIEFFKARLNNKMSKLKTARMIAAPPFSKYDTAQIWGEIFQYLFKLNEDIKTEKLFDAIVSTYDQYSFENNHKIKTYISMRILDALGIWPVINFCVVCKRYDMIENFDLSYGGFLCNLHSKNKMNISELKAWRSLFGTLEDYLEVDHKINKVIFGKITNMLKGIY